MIRLLTILLAVVMCSAPALQSAAQPHRESPTCPNGRSAEAAMWLSILHPGLGEYHLRGWGAFSMNCPQKKFWLGFIPLYGWPGYLQVKSAIDARNCRSDDRI